MKTNHHAVLLIADATEGAGAALAVLGLSKDEHRDSPDVHVLSYERFGIDEARMLKEASSGRPVSSPFRSFVLVCGHMTGEAQNALLKLFEDPPATARFVLVVPRESAVIPTLRSRLHAVPFSGAAADTSLAEGFLAASYEERLADVALRTKAKDDAWAQQLLNGLEAVLAARQEGARHERLRDVLFVRRYALARGASMKMLLEHLAVSLPPR